MLTDSEINRIKSELEECEKGYSSNTRGSFRYLIKMASKELGGHLGEVNCITCRKFVIGYWNKQLKRHTK